MIKFKTMKRIKLAKNMNLKQVKHKLTCRVVYLSKSRKSIIKMREQIKLERNAVNI